MAAVGGTGGFRRRSAAAIAGLLCAAVLCAQTEGTEYQVKAAFLMNFTKFVDWPASAFQNSESPLTICVLGEDPFGGALDQVVENETAGGRRLAVQRLHRMPPAKTCQVLFISRSERDQAALVAAAGSGVLTVGDQEGFLREGGIIAFVLQAHHVRFDINLQAAARAGLAISSRLLSVARRVQK